MKFGIAFDTCQEAEEVIHYGFITSVWLNKDSFKSFNLTTQIHMSKFGYDVERIDSFKSLIDKSKTWTFRNIQPIKTIFTKADLMQWTELYEICREIYMFEESMRTKHVLKKLTCFNSKKF